MRINSADYLTSSVTFEGCPAATLPEFAVIGRSNVGKSTLINLLTNRKALARVSSTPGHTRMINFFAINKAWHLIDLPGYGYAKGPVDDRGKFTGMISEYLTRRGTLRGTFVLIDGSIPPQKIDLAFTRWLIEEAVPFVLVFTKIDRVSAARAQDHITQFIAGMSEFCENSPMIFKTSARKKTGHLEILQFIAAVLAKTA